jgi:site-specific recombinase XerD
MRHPRRHVPARPAPSARGTPRRPRPEPHVSLLTAASLRTDELEAAGRDPAYRAIGERVGRRFCAFLRKQEAAYVDDAAVPLAALTTENVRAFLIWLRTDFQTRNPLTGRAVRLGARAIQQHAATLKALARFCVREALLADDPLAVLRTPKVPKKVIEVFTAAQLRLLIREAELGPQPARDRAILYLLLATGVRASELCQLRLIDLEVRERRAKVLGTGAQWRWVGFDATTAKHLTRYLALRGVGGPPEVFLSRTGAPMSRHGLQRLIHKLGVWAGIGDQVRCSPHTFRHTAATAFLRAHPGAVLHLQALLGHEELEMTRRYARLVQGDALIPGAGPVQALGLDQPERKPR